MFLAGTLPHSELLYPAVNRWFGVQRNRSRTARRALLRRRQVIIAERQTDVAAVHAAGLDTTVGAAGTSVRRVRVRG